MKKFFAVTAIAGMAVLTSCGNAEDLAKKMQDSINKADSVMREQMKADSIQMADSIANEAAKAAEATKADSIAGVAHADSVAKGLIKEKK